ncbi:MAG: glycoside hydrolase family 88 protein [Prevotella sp.]|nr:glycoside hydrolase family 88 protein [Bacteroidaceae bacterium]MBR0268388.1 glycoside hydrolase family 88 protein [Prevotella sp.]
MLKRILFILALTLTAVTGLRAQEQYSGNIVADEGAWCWFADPRALHYENTSGTINATYLGYIDVHGNVMATQYDWLTGRKTDVLIRSYFQPDDHNNPTFVVLPDERVMIFYTRHTDEAKIWYRISRKPGDISALGEEKYLATANNTTYPSPFILSDDPTHIYLCWRGINWHPTIARLTMPDADDNCQFDFGPKQIVQSTGARPYAKYQSNGKDKIYLSYTTGHPDNEMPDWLYFNVIDINNGNGPILRDIKGTELKKVADGVFNVNKQSSYASSYPLTIVDNSSNIRNWVWQITLDENENPVIAYPHIDDAKTTHVYWYARWNGTEWKRTWVQYGGHAFHQNWNSTERCYSGGMTIDPDNIHDLYLSIPTSGGEYSKDGVYEIWKYTINDAGEVAGKEQITRNSAKNNVRPFIIPGSKNSPMRLAWMNGDYYYWMVQKNYPKGYPTDIRCDHEWTETQRDVAAAEADGISLSVGQTLQLTLAMNDANYGGTLLATADGTTLRYALDAASQYPELTLSGTTYRSQNRLLTSDNWATNSTGTSGDNHPTKLQTWVLTIVNDGKTLTVYRNGLVDQVVEAAGIDAGNVVVQGSGFNSSCLSAKTFGVAATPLEVQTLARAAQTSLETEKAQYALDMISLPEEVRADMVLPSGNLGLGITWASSNPGVLTASGLVIFPKTATDVTLTATCSGKTRRFTVRVLPRDITKNVRYTLPAPLDMTQNTNTGFATNTYGMAPEGLLQGLRSYSVVITAKPTTMTKQPRLYDFGSASGNSLFLRADALSAGVKYNGGTTTMVNATTKLVAGTEYKLAVTFNAATRVTTIYIDGKENASGTANQVEPYQLAELAADTRNYIGRTQWWDGAYSADNHDFCGTISDLRLYDVCLTQQEVCEQQDIPYEQEVLPTALVNGDFEGTYSVLAGTGVSSDRAIYLPEGWNIDRTNGDVNDITALKAGDLQFNSFFASLAKPEAGGTQTYWIRQKWGTSTITLWQKLLLPEGRYTLTCNIWKSGLGGDAKVSVVTEGGNTVSSPSLDNKTEWQAVSFDFQSDGTAATTIRLSAIHTSDGSEKLIGWDNVVITKKEGTEPSEPFAFRLRNSLGFDRSGETVVVNVPEGTSPSLCTLTDEDGNVIPFEVIGTSAIRFLATVAAGKTMGYTLAEGIPVAPEKLTYAAVKAPGSRDDIAWENDLSAYRMYSARLVASEPNTAQGVDVWSKKQATPIIDAMYGLSNYHNESQYGVDAYSVNGKRLGCGGVAVVENGHLVMHDPYNTCTISANDALASAFTLIYNNVKAGEQTYTETLTVETRGGALLNRGTVRLDPAIVSDGSAIGTIRLAVALYQHTDMSHNANGVAFTGEEGIIGWADNKSEGTVTSPGARFFQGAYVPAEANPRTEVIDNHLCLTFDYIVGTEQTFYFGAGWNIFPAGCYASDDDWFFALEQFRDKVLSPLTVTSMTELPTKASVINILNTVNQTWQEKHPSHGDHFWNRAVYHIGNMAAYEATGDGVYRDFSTAWATRNNWWGSTGTNKANWKYSYGEGADYVLFGDNQVCFQVYADLYRLDTTPDETKIARALEVMGYEISTSAVDYLWWVDGLFMVMPVMTKLYNITGNQAYLDKMYQYWQYANGIMYDGETGLYFRDAKYVYPAHTTSNGLKDFWARGDGWIFAAFAKVLNELPVTDIHRDEYITYYRRLAAALKDCQQDEGYWTRSLLDPAQAPGYETSGTALNTFAYAWGIRNGILDELEYGQTLERAWHYLSTVALQPDGTVGYIQPIGESASPGTTVNANSYHDFGVGAYLLAASEMSRLAVGEAVKPHLRLSEVRLISPTEIFLRFNLQPDANDAANMANYTVNGQPVAGKATVYADATVSITLDEALDYGRYTIAAAGIRSAEGGEMQAGQERLVVLTVPLDEPQTGITITAEGSQDGNPYSNVNDGSLDTRWSYEGMNKWIRFDLRSAQRIYAVDVAFYNGNARVFYFKIQTSANGTTWTDATGNLTSSGLTNEMERYYFTPVNARYVRLLCSGNSTNNWNSPTEIRIRYGEDPDGIGQINSARPANKTVGAAFDLLGSQMLSRQWPQGIYVVDGKKILSK